MMDVGCCVLQLLECMYVRQALDLLEGLIPESEDNKDISSSHLKLLIVFAIMWSLGALLELSDRRKVHGVVVMTRMSLFISSTLLL